MHNVDDFSTVTALSSGARFVRGDLHIHSFGGSHDVSDPTATPEAIVQTAVDNGLSIIAIADHNAVTSVQAAIDAAVLQFLLVVPAVELSTPQGHLLCYLPDVAKLTQFFAQLTLRDPGQPTSRVENSMLDCLHRVETFGGFGVLAHVDGPKGLEMEVPGASPHKGDILNHAALLGIELKTAKSMISYCPNDPDAARKGLGKVRVSQGGGGLVPPLARLLNSDAHTLDMLGRNAAGDRKVTRYKLQALTFDALKHALRDSDARVRLEDEVPKAVPLVTGIRFRGGFLKDQAIHFSPNLTCIIGGRGTGKSTMFEGVRAFSRTPSGASVINSDVWPDRVDVEFLDEASERHRLVWSKGDSCGVNLNDPLCGPETLPVECYGQGETQKISEQAQADPGALLRYLDRFTDVLTETAAEEALRAEIQALDGEIAASRAQVALIPQTQRDLAITQQQIRKFKDGDAKKLIETYQQIETERQARRSVVDQVRDLGGSLNHETAKTSLRLLLAAADESKLTLGKEEFAAIRAEAATFQSNLTTSEHDLLVRSQALSEFVRVKVEAWSTKEKTLLAEVDAQRAALEAQGVTVNTAYLSKISQDEASYEAQLAKLQTWEPILADQLTKREALCVQRWAARKVTYAKRKAFAAAATRKLRSTLSDLNVSLKFEESAHAPGAQDILIEIMAWRTNQVPRASLIVRGLTVPKLIDAIVAKNPQPITALLSDDGATIFTAQEAATLIDRFSDPATLARLETSQVYDRPYLTVTRETVQGGQTKYLTREFAQLSLGQQQSVLLALMLSSENPNPLLIDQPEDNLDGQFIYSQLVPVIRRAKEHRQIIIVTHNPNIAVLGDAEQIVVLAANNERSQVVARGSIDDADTRQRACNILEGAKSAFTRRGKIYGL